MEAGGGTSAGGRPKSPPCEEEELAAIMGRAFVRSLARRKRDREYSAARREAARFEEDVAAARLIHLAESLERAREERQQLEEEAALLRGRLAIRDETVAFLREGLATARASRDAEARGRSDELSAVAKALVARYGEGVGVIVDAIRRFRPSQPFGRDRVEALSELAQLPVTPPPRNGGRMPQPMPYGLVLELLPFGQHWAGWLLSQVNIYYMEKFFLNPDCPMYMVSTMFPANFERTVLNDELTPARFGELVQLNSDANILSPEARVRAWAVQTRVSYNVLSRFRTADELASREFVDLVTHKLAPAARFLTVQFLARVAGENRWMFTHLDPPRWSTDEEALDRLMSRLNVSIAQKRHINRLFDEMMGAVDALGLDLRTSTAGAIEAISQTSSVASHLKLLEHLGVAASSSIRLRQVIGWYGFILQYAFSMRQLTIAVHEANRPLWSLELVVPIVTRYKNELAQEMAAK